MCTHFKLFSPVGLIIIESLEVTTEISETSTQLNIIFITTGGPATNVTWTRDSDTVTEGTETVLDDRVTAQYTHTLTVTETTTFPITYSCRVSTNGQLVHISMYIFTYKGMSMYLPSMVLLYRSCISFVRFLVNKKQLFCIYFVCFYLTHSIYIMPLLALSLVSMTYDHVL